MLRLLGIQFSVYSRSSTPRSHTGLEDISEESRCRAWFLWFLPLAGWEQARGLTWTSSLRTLPMGSVPLKRALIFGLWLMARNNGHNGATVKAINTSHTSTMFKTMPILPASRESSKKGLDQDQWRRDKDGVQEIIPPIRAKITTLVMPTMAPMVPRLSKTHIRSFCVRRMRRFHIMMIG